MVTMQFIQAQMQNQYHKIEFIERQSNDMKKMMKKMLKELRKEKKRKTKKREISPGNKGKCKPSVMTLRVKMMKKAFLALLVPVLLITLTMTVV